MIICVLDAGFLASGPTPAYTVPPLPGAILKHIPHVIVTSAEDSNTPLPGFESDVLPLHYTSGKANGNDG